MKQITLQLHRPTLWGLAAFICLLAWSPAGAAEAAKCTQKGTGGVDVLKGTPKKDVLCGKGGEDFLIGKGGNDKLKGGAGDDTLTAKAGDDTLSGGAGDDTLSGGKGNDKLQGNAGIDVAAFADSPASMAIDLSTGTASGDGNDTLIGVENAIGSPGDDSLAGDAGPNDLSAGEGADTLVGGGGDDVLEAQGGYDVVSYQLAANGVIVDLPSEAASGQGSDIVKGAEVVLGSAHDDLLAGDSADNVLDGGAGTDTVSFERSPAAVSVNLSARIAEGYGDDTLQSLERVIGSAHGDNLTGDDAANVIAGGAGDDTLTGGAGNDMLDGQAGADTLTGGAGDDVLDGQAGADTLTGGAGDDVLDGQGGADTASYVDSGAPVDANLRIATVSGQGTDTLAGIENLTGSGQPDTLAGDAGPNVLDGGEGFDVISFVGSPASIHASLATGVSTGDGADTLLGLENVIGSAHDDTIAGAGGANLIAGGLGVDTLSGAEGNDQLAGEDGNDMLVGGGDDDGLQGGGGDDHLDGGDEDDGLQGGGGDDHLDGGGGVNDCDGGTGANTFAGNCDGETPALTAFSLSPGSVDTSAAPWTIDFTLSATDDTGLDPTASQVIVHGPDGQPTFETGLVLVSGTPRAGSYSAAIELPRYAAQGTWTVEVRLVDELSNQVLITSSQLISSGYPGVFQQTGAGDTTTPSLNALTLSSTSIDTSAASRTVTVDLDAGDDLAGIDAAASTVIVHGPGGQPTFEISLALISGTSTNGSYRAEIVIPRYSAQGEWTVELKLVDSASNQTVRTTAQLSAAGFPSSFQQTGAGDTVAPLLTGFAFTPAEINTAAADRTITFTLSATDNLSGIDPAASKVIAKDPVSQPQAGGALTLTGGPPTAGTYSAAVTIPQGSATGIWEVEVELVDEIGNHRVITSSELIAAGFPGTFENVAPGGS